MENIIVINGMPYSKAYLDAVITTSNVIRVNGFQKSSDDFQTSPTEYFIVADDDDAEYYNRAGYGCCYNTSIDEIDCDAYDKYEIAVKLINGFKLCIDVVTNTKTWYYEIYEYFV